MEEIARSSQDVTSAGDGLGSEDPTPPGDDALLDDLARIAAILDPVPGDCWGDLDR